MSAESLTTVSVVYALPDQQPIVEIEFLPGMTAIEAFERSGLAERFPEIRNDQIVLGIFGVEVDLNLELKPGDRVEISRPLLADPRDMRRELLAGGKVMGGASAADAAIRKKGRG